MIIRRRCTIKGSHSAGTTAVNCSRKNYKTTDEINSCISFQTEHSCLDFHFDLALEWMKHLCDLAIDVLPSRSVRYLNQLSWIKSSENILVFINMRFSARGLRLKYKTVYSWHINSGSLTTSCRLIRCRLTGGPSAAAFYGTPSCLTQIPTNHYILTWARSTDRSNDHIFSKFLTFFHNARIKKHWHPLVIYMYMLASWILFEKSQYKIY